MIHGITFDVALGLGAWYRDVFLGDVWMCYDS